MATVNQGIISSAQTDPNAPTTTPAAPVTTTPSPVTNTPSAATTAPAPTTANNPLVSSWYTNHLGRDADQAGSDYWSGQLAAPGANPTQVYQNFLDAAKQNGENVNGTTQLPGGSTGYSPALLGTPTQLNVNGNQTTAGQLTQLLDPNSPLIQQARSNAMQTANNRGLLNSSIASTGADEAAYAAAIPIATADAQTYNSAAGYNANQSNIFKQQDTNALNTAGQFNAGAQNTFMGQQLNSNTSKSIASQNNDTQVKIANIQKEAQSGFQGASNATSLANNYQNAIANIGALNMDASAKADLQNNVFQAYQQAVKALDQKLGIPDTSGLLTFNPISNAGPTPGNLGSGIISGAQQ